VADYIQEHMGGNIQVEAFGDAQETLSAIQKRYYAWTKAQPSGYKGRNIDTMEDYISANPEERLLFDAAAEQVGAKVYDKEGRLWATDIERRMRDDSTVAQSAAIQADPFLREHWIDPERLMPGKSEKLKVRVAQDILRLSQAYGTANNRAAVKAKQDRLVRQAVYDLLESEGVEVTQDIRSIGDARELAGVASQALGMESQTFGGFHRTFNQFVIDRMNPTDREDIRKAFYNAVRHAWENDRAGEVDFLSVEASPSIEQGVQKVFKMGTWGTPAYKQSQKTGAAINSTVACPMFVVGNTACWIDACYLTNMGASPGGLTYYEHGLYTAEVLQESNATVEMLNRQGGMRLNGYGDILPGQTEQFIDIIRDSRDRVKKGGAVLLNKIISKQGDAFAVVQEAKNAGIDVSHVQVQPSMDFMWIPVEVDMNTPGNGILQRLGAGGRTLTAEEGMAMVKRSPDAVIEYYREQSGREAKVFEDGVMYRKYGLTTARVEELRAQYPDVQALPRYVVATPQELAEAALQTPLAAAEGEMASPIITLMHGVLDERIVSDLPGGGTFNVGDNRHKMVKGRGIAGVKHGGGVKDVAAVYDQINNYIAENYTAEQQEHIFKVMEQSVCCQENSSKEACAGCASHCANHAYLDDRQHLPADMKASATPLGGRQLINIEPIDDSGWFGVAIEGDTRFAVKPGHESTAPDGYEDRLTPQSLEDTGRPGGLDPWYVPQSNPETERQANEWIDRDGIDVVESTILGRVEMEARDVVASIKVLDARQVAAQALAAEAETAEGEEKTSLEAKADLMWDRALAMSTVMTQRLTKAGQYVQSASMIARLSPVGVTHWAQRKIDEHNKELSEWAQTHGKQKKLTRQQAAQLRNRAIDLQKWTNIEAEAKDVELMTGKVLQGEELTPENENHLYDLMDRMEDMAEALSASEDTREAVKGRKMQEDISKLAEVVDILMTRPVEPITEKQIRAIAGVIKNLRLMSGDAAIEASQEISSTIAKITDPTWLQKLSTLQTMFHLLNPKTAIRNIVGNELFYRLERLNMYPASMIDWAYSSLTGSDRVITFRKAEQSGYWDAFMKERAAAMRGEKWKDVATRHDLPATMTFRNPGILNYLEKIMAVELRGFDSAAWNRAYWQHLGEVGELAADKQGLRGKQRDAWIKNWLAAPSAEAVKAADEYGRYVTFQDDNILSTTAVKAKHLLNLGKDWGGGDLLIKYPKTPSNLVMRAIEYSPMGFAISLNHLAKPLYAPGKVNRRALTLALSRAITGSSGFTMMGYYLVANGVLTGGGEDDWKEWAFRRDLTGEGPYRVNVSALQRWAANRFGTPPKPQQGDTLISYDWALPVAMSIAVGANAREATQAKSQRRWAGQVDKMIQAGFKGAMRVMMDQPMLEGFQTLFEGYGGPDGLGENMLRIVEGIPTQVVPTFINQIRQISDNTRRETYAPTLAQRSINKAMNRLPFISDRLPVAYKAIGKSVPREIYNNGGNDWYHVFFNPSFVSEYMISPEVQMLLDVSDESGVRLRPRNIGRSYDVGKEDLMRAFPRRKFEHGLKFDITGEDRAELQRMLAERLTVRIAERKMSTLRQFPPKMQLAFLNTALRKATEDVKLSFAKNMAQAYMDRGDVVELRTGNPYASLED